MTPIKEIWVIMDTVFALDFADNLNLIGHTPSEETALRIALAESAYHGRDAYAFKPALRRMVPLGGAAREYPTALQLLDGPKDIRKGPPPKDTGPWENLVSMLDRAMAILQVFPEEGGVRLDVSDAAELKQKLAALREDYTHWIGG
jgi:hypothetical protein